MLPGCPHEKNVANQFIISWFLEILQKNLSIDNYKIYVHKTSIFSKRWNPIFKAQGDKNKLMEKEAPGSFSEGRGDHIL